MPKPFPKTYKAALLTAAKIGDCETAFRLLEVAENINYPCDKDDSTALTIASMNGHIEMVRRLISAGADVNHVTSDEGLTPIFLAAQEGHDEIVSLLIDANADVNRASADDGQTPLYNAASRDQVNVVRLLIKVKASQRIARTEDGEVPLHAAVRFKHVGVVAELLNDKEVDINCRDFQGRVPLYYAVKNGYNEIVRLLLNAGADPDVVTETGESLHGLAKECGFFKIVRLLKKSLQDFQERLDKINDKTEIPDAFCDPVSLEIMEDPVTLSNGQTYDRESLWRQFNEHPERDFFVCPLTNAEINKKELNNGSNVRLKDLIEQFVSDKEREFVEKSSHAASGKRKKTHRSRVRLFDDPVAKAPDQAVVELLSCTPPTV